VSQPGEYGRFCGLISHPCPNHRPQSVLDQHPDPYCGGMEGPPQYGDAAILTSTAARDIRQSADSK